MYANYNTISKEGAGIYVFFPSSETLNFISAMVDNNWLFKQMLVWKKIIWCLADKIINGFTNQYCMAGKKAQHIIGTAIENKPQFCSLKKAIVFL